jgi:hypothetical protein
MVAAPDPRSGEVRLCLESTLGLGAVAAGLGWRFWSAGPPVDLALGGLVLALAAVATFGPESRTVQGERR